MSLRYSWNDSNVSKVDFGQNFNSQKEATIFASPNADAGALAALPAAFSNAGMQVYFDFVDGQNVLKVMNYSNEADVSRLLQRTQAVQGTPLKQEMKDSKESKGVIRTIRENGTNIAGALGMAGHAALIASGYIAHEKERVAAGMQYGASAGILAIWGAGSDKPFQRLCAGLYDHLQNEGIGFTSATHTTPMNAYLHRGMAEKAYDTFKSNSILASNIIGVGGNISMLKSGVDVAKRDGIMMGIGRGAHGAVNLMGAGVASFVEEKDEEHLDRQKQKQARDERIGSNGGISSIPHKIAGWISRYPLGFQGGIFLADNASAFGDVAAIRKRYIQRQKTDFVELPTEPISPYAATSPLSGLQEGTSEYKAMLETDRYKGWKKDADAWQKNSKEYKAWKKEYDGLMHTKVGHIQRLELNAQKIQHALTESAPEVAKKIGEVELSALSGIPKAETCLSHVKVLDAALASVGGHSGQLDALLKERRVLMQELEEVQKYPGGWKLALAKACLWTASSTFQAFATKNKKVSLEQKYGELYAYVATMALDVPQEQRALMVHKSAEFLASHDGVYIKAEEIEKGIHQKLDTLVSSPWINVTPAMVQAKADAAIAPETSPAKDMASATPESTLQSSTVLADGKLFDEPAVSKKPAADATTKPTPKEWVAKAAEAQQATAAQLGA